MGEAKRRRELGLPPREKKTEKGKKKSNFLVQYPNINSLDNYHVNSLVESCVHCFAVVWSLVE